MRFRVSRSTIFRCSLERAFRTPMLCDVTKVHTGYLLMPPFARLFWRVYMGRVLDNVRRLAASNEPYLHP